MEPSVNLPGDVDRELNRVNKFKISSTLLVSQFIAKNNKHMDKIEFTYAKNLKYPFMLSFTIHKTEILYHVRK